MRALLPILLAALTGCGAAITPAEVSDTGASAESGTDSGVSTTETSVPPVTGSCKKTSDGLDLTVSGAGLSLNCSGPPTEPAPTTGPLRGQIVGVDASSFQLDRCSPAADCVPMISTFVVKAPGLDLRVSLRKDSYVEVNVAVTRSWGCTRTIVIKSLDAWDAVKNPADIGGRTYLVGSDGLLDVVGSPFKVTKVPHGCLPGVKSCGSDVPDYYSLDLSGGAGTVGVPMGETVFGLKDGKGQPYVVRNLRSLYEGWCDAYWDYAYWITPAAVR